MRGRRLLTTERLVAVATDLDDPIVEQLRDWVDENGLYLELFAVGDDIAGALESGTRTVGVTIGGDGTFLEGIKAFAPLEIPVVGVDLGTRAFLTRVSPEAMTDALAEVIRGEASIEERARLRVRTDGLDATGLNDVMLRHAPPAQPVDRKVTRFDAFLNREYVGSFEGTAMLASTPTGSTGMALSAGGPIHYPRTNHTLQLTPVLIHDLSARSLVLHDDFPLLLRAADPVELSVDGGRHHRTLEAEATVRVERAPQSAHIIRTSVEPGEFETLADRLGWHPWRRPVPSAPSPVVKHPDEDDTLSHARVVAEEAARSVGAPLRELHGKTESIEYKTDKADLVTEADFQSESIITSIIENEFPGHNIHSEETVHHEGGSRYTWIIDPLDGTGNYANGNPNYAVSIALVEDDRPVVGVVYAPETDELFSAVDGGRALRNGSPISTTERDHLDESVFMSGYDPDGAFLVHFYNVTRGVRRLGSAALHLCYLAAGSCDASWEYDTLPWDVAAGVVIARAAGARITDVHGNDYAIFGGDDGQNELVGSNGPLHPAVLDHLYDHDTLGSLGE